MINIIVSLVMNIIIAELIFYYRMSKEEYKVMSESSLKSVKPILLGVAVSTLPMAAAAADNTVLYHWCPNVEEVKLT